MTKRQHEQIRRAAARGAKWLDKQMPGWSRKIKRRKLNLGNTCGCVLGQIGMTDGIGDYANMVDDLGLSDPECERLGFTVLVDLNSDDDAWADLTAAWRDELKARPR